MATAPANMTLQQAILYFSDEDNCIRYMVELRWPDGKVACPTCGRTDVSWLAVQKRWQCKSKHAKRQFSAKVGTIFEDSPLGLDKWILATWMIANCRNGVSSYEIARTIGVTQKSAWHMLHRIRLAMRDEQTPPFGSGEGGEVEVDEAYVGAKTKNMHYSRKLKIQRQQNEMPAYKQTSRYAGKTPVMGLYDRASRQVRAKVVPNVRRETLQREIMDKVVCGSAIYSDQAVAYDSLKDKFIHETVNHIDHYVRGAVHTNCLENFWSLMKRNLAGTYVAVEPFHLDRYLDEQVYRFNNRQNKTDEQRFSKLLGQVAGRRLTYADLTGKVGETASF